MSRLQDIRTSEDRYRGQDYLLAIAAVALCTAVALAFSTLAREVPFLIFFPAVLFSLWVGGFRAAIFSSVLSAIAADFFFLPPYFSFSLRPRDMAKEVLFVVVIVASAWAFERRRKRTEGFIRLQHTLLETAAESILVIDTQRNIVSWNHGAELLYGWTEQEVLGQPPRVLLDTTYPEPLENIKRQLQETGHWRGRLVRKCKDGRRIVVESSWAVDKETGFILQAGTDVSEQSRSEAELKHVNRALRALSRINQVLIHATSADHLLQQAVEIIVQEGGYPLAWIGFPSDDSEHSIRIGPACGRAVAALSGIKLKWSDEPAGHGPCGTALREGRSCVVHNFLSDPDCSPWREIAGNADLRSAISLPLIVQGVPCAALTLYSNDEGAFEGREFDLVSEIAGDLAFGLSSIRLREQAEEERTSRQLLEQQLRQAQKMEAIGRLAGGISHDFNNLLMIIMAQTELLSLQVTGTALARTESVMKSAQRAADLTRQLLAFSRKQIVQPKITSLNPILTDIAKMATHLLGEDIELATALCDQPWPVNIDRSQIEQVVMNLIVNARDAMPNGGQLTLETSNADLTTEYIATHPLVTPGRYFLLAVSDTGMGMDEETKARLFEPFFTTKGPGKGTGLGLSMVYGIVKQSGGFIWYYSELGKGTCFKIYLPAAPVVESDYEPAAAAQPVRSTRPSTILLVEDEQSLREVIAEFLRSGGYRVITAESPEEAKERAAEYGDAIDLLLTDVVLRGGQNGKQLANALLNKVRRIRIIYMSGYTPNAIVHHGVLDEATMFLQKPFTRTALLAKVQEALIG